MTFLFIVWRGLISQVQKLVIPQLSIRRNVICLPRFHKNQLDLPIQEITSWIGKSN